MHLLYCGSHLKIKLEGGVKFLVVLFEELQGCREL